VLVAAPREDVAGSGEKRPGRDQVVGVRCACERPPHRAPAVRAPEQDQAGDGGRGLALRRRV
jgi:hypothetical protein